MSKSLWSTSFWNLIFSLLASVSLLDQVVAQSNAQTVSVGAGSYASTLPAGADRPPAKIYRTDRCQGPMPTNDWWSSLAWEPLSSPMFPHPLAIQAVTGGLRVNYPGPSIVANVHGIIGGGGSDFVIGHSAVNQFIEAKVDSFSDWFVTASFQSGEQELLTSFGHGSPFVYVQTKGGSPTLIFTEMPTIWSESSKDAAANKNVLGISIANRHYGLFAPTGSHWLNLNEKMWTVEDGGKHYFSVALLPDNQPETLAQFQRYAFAHVSDTKVNWKFDSESATVTTDFFITTQVFEGSETETLFALYPHQWSSSESDFTQQEYVSVRGPMKLAVGSGFSTRMKYRGVLPSLPIDAVTDQKLLKTLVKEESDTAAKEVADTYWFGKQLGIWSTLLPIAEQLGDRQLVDSLTRKTQRGLQNFFTATGKNKQAKQPAEGLFAYDKNWGTLIGYPASYGSANDLNDHHFHYGYFIRAAGEIARRDPQWAAKENWGGMVRLLIRDVASPDRTDAMFPFLRNFDPYAGHTWASGHGKFGDGNNNESSSEAINAWYGMILFGEATGDAQIRDLGIYLMTTEVQAINDYWFDVTDQFHHPDYQPTVVTMVWGGKGANATWFSGNPELVHGINWLPITGGSLYLGQYPEYCEKNYQALLSENLADDQKRPKKDLPSNHNVGDLDAWQDLVWMYRALSDPTDAMSQFENRRPDFAPEEGNTLTNVLVWISFFQKYGQVDRTITADTTFYAVMKHNDQRHYFAWNLSSKKIIVTFSDGTTLDVPANSLANR